MFHLARSASIASSCTTLKALVYQEPACDAVLDTQSSNHLRVFCRLLNLQTRPSLIERSEHVTCHLVLAVCLLVSSVRSCTSSSPALATIPLHLRPRHMFPLNLFVIYVDEVETE